jgi:hypothetical protein
LLIDSVFILAGGAVLYRGAVRLGHSSERNTGGWFLMVAGISLAAVGTWRFVAALMAAALS